MNGWIGVDLDGTLARYEGRKGAEDIGEPVPAMLERVKLWLREGRKVKIFTARAALSDQIPAIEQWLACNGLPGLEITNRKDYGMVELWDDRCIRVEQNTGKILSGGSI